MNREEILHELKERGYRFTITEKDNNKNVEFIGKYSLEPYKVKHSYSTEYTNYEIELDLVYDLLRWSGYTIKETLELNI